MKNNSPKIEKVAMVSENIENENLNKLRSIFPQFVKDGSIDFDALQAFFKKEGVLAGTEKYGLSWAGKSNAFKVIRTSATGTLAPQMDESKNWDTTENIFIEGDNLEVLKLLQKKYSNPGKIKMIYIDPPYNTGNDFIYTDNFTENKNDYYERTGQSCGGIKLTSNPESNGRYHSDWLTMMYPRLFLARNLLKDDGVIFISIDDNEVANLRMVMDEIFGEENFVAQFPWRKRTAKSDVPFGVSQDYEWIICFAKSDLFSASIEGNERKYYESPDLPNRPWRIHDMTTQRTSGERPNSNFTMVDPKTNKKYPVNSNAVWRVTKESFNKFYSENKIIFPGDYNFLNISKPVLRYFKDEDELKSGEKFGFVPVSTNLPKDIGMTQDGTKDIGDIFENKVFAFPKPVNLLKYFTKIATLHDKSSIILDFFAGSGTTAHAVMDLNAEDNGNRKWICVQIPEGTGDDSEACKAGYKTITEISRERIRRAGKKLYEDKADINNPKVKAFDYGFKSFKLSSSNYRKWNTLTAEDDEKALLQQAKLFTERPLIDKYDEQAVVYEILLKEGFDLNATVIEEIKKKGISLWIVTDSEKKMVVTFTQKLTKEQFESLELPKDYTFICFDSALDDTTKVNIMRNLTVKTI